MKYKNIAHLADIHIRLASRQDEYMTVFKRLSKSFKKENVDLIVIAGDLFHSKVNLSPEAIDVATKMMDMFLEQCDVILIPGNHDANLESGGDRLDAISPFVELYKRNSNATHKIHYLKDTQVYELNNVRFFHYSVFDEEVPNLDYISPDKTNIALFHGMIKGAKDDTGITYNDTERDIPFSKYDHVMLGDIHKHQKLNENTWYAGSTIQQKTSENPLDHGYIKWSLNDKDLFEPQLIRISNDYGYYTIRFENGEIKSEYNQIPNKASIYVVVSKNDTKEEALEKCRKKYNTDKIYPLPEKVDDEGREIVFQKNVLDLYDYATNHKVFEEYLEGESDETKKEILNIHKILFKENIVKGEQKGFKPNYKIKKIEFSNALPFGEGNILDFNKLRGTIGLFAPNSRGKSSLCDVISYSVFGAFPNMKKNDSFLNSNAKKFNTNIVVDQDGYRYTLERQGNRIKNGINNSIKFKREKNGTVENLGDDIPEINKKINHYFGDLDTFIQLSYFRQSKTDSFLELTPTKRNDWITNNLGLEVFDALHGAGKDKSKDLRSEVDQLEKVDYKAKEMDILQEINTLKEKIKEKDDYIKSDLDPELKKLNKKISDLRDLNVDTTLCDQTDNIEKIKSDINDMKKNISEYENHDVYSDDIVKSYKETIKKLESEIEELKSLDIEKEAVSESDELKKQLDEVITKGKKIKEEITKLEKDYDSYKDNREEVDRLKEIVSNIDDTKRKIDANQQKLENLKESVNSLEQEYKDSNREDLCDVCPLLDKSKRLKKSWEEKYNQFKEESKLKEELQKKLLEEEENSKKLQKEEEYLSNRLEAWKSLEDKKEERKRLLDNHAYVKEQMSSLMVRKEKEMRDNVKSKENNISEYNNLIDNRIKELEANKKTWIANLNDKLQTVEEKRTELQAKHKKWEDQKDLIEKVSKIDDYQKEYDEFNNKKDNINEEIDDLKVEVKYQNKLLNENKEQKILLKKKKDEVQYFEKYIQMTHRNSLPLSIIKRILSIFESEVNYVLEKISDFRSHIYVEKDKIMVDIEDFRGRRSADRLGGMESFSFNIAFRIGIAEVGNLPMSNVLIIDEHLSVMDANNSQNIPDLFAYLKTKFDVIFVIAHEQTMRDYVDSNIDIVLEGKNSKLIT